MIKRFIFFILFMWYSAWGFSQTAGGNIHGTVRQPNQPVIPGVRVTLSSVGGGQMYTVTSAHGNFRFINLSSDTYRLTFEKAGLKTVIYRGVRIYSGKSKTLNIHMQSGTADPPVIISGAGGAVDTRSPAQTAHITKEMLQSLPTARNPWAIFNLAPGVLLDREEVGGSESGQQSVILGPGTLNNDNNWYIDGTDITDLTVPGAAPAYINSNFFEEIQVTTAANDIRYRSGGTHLNFVSRKGGNMFRGDIFVYAENDSLELEQTVPQSIIDRGWVSTGIYRLYQYGANLGGPLIKNHLWFYGSYGVQDIQYRTVTGERDSTWLDNIAVKIDFRFGGMSGFFRFSDDSKNKWDRFLNSFGLTANAYSTRLEQDGHSKFFSGSLQQEMGSLVLNVKISHINNGFHLDPASADINSTTGHLEGLDMITYSFPTNYLDGSGLYYNVKRKRTDLSIDGSYFIEGLVGSDHEIRFGVDYCNATTSSQSLYPNQRELYIADRNDPSGYKEIWWRTDSLIDSGYNRVAFYLSDTITFARLTTNIGLRYDREANSHNTITQPGLTFNGTPIYAHYMGALTIPARSIIPAFEVFSPRISFSYDISGNGADVLKASFARYGAQGGFDMANFLWLPLEREIDVYWDDKNNDLKLDWGEWSEDPDDWLWWNINKDNPTATVSNNQIDPNLKSPIQTEITVGFEKALAEDFMVALNAFYKKTGNLIRDIGLFSDTGTPDSAANWYMGGTYTFSDGRTKEYYLRYTNPDARYRTNYGSGTYNEYMALQMIVSKKLSHGWMFDASFTYSDWKSHYDPAEYFDKTNFDFFNGSCMLLQSGDFETSRVYVNARWQAKIAGLLQLPLGFNLSGVFRVREGYINPYYEVFYRPGIGRAIIYEPDKKFGDDRLPTFWILNLAVEKVIYILPTLNVTLFVNGYNITNNSTSLKVNPVLNTTDTGQPLHILNPCIFQFGVRVTF